MSMFHKTCFQRYAACVRFSVFCVIYFAYEAEDSCHLIKEYFILIKIT